MMGWGTSTWVLVKSNARPEEEEVSHKAGKGACVYDGVRDLHISACQVSEEEEMKKNN